MLVPSEEVAVVATIDPDANAAGALTSDWADATQFQQFMCIVQTGVMGAAATLDVKLQQATDSSGTGNKDITNAAVTQLVKATNDDDQAIINLNADALDVAGGFTHVAIVHTVGTAQLSRDLRGTCIRKE
jgi:hypothetical protein